ncbi:MAG: PilZ domain-containing protein [Novosphingobium sp.]|nr:PilZ domain-containing protein [Novosphingobium sp.]
MEQKRASQRLSIFVQARCRESSWVVRDAALVDISAEGCSVAARGKAPALGAEVEIRLNKGARAAGVVRWTDGDRVGIRFCSPLAAATLAQIGAAHGRTAPAVHPLRSVSAE